MRRVNLILAAASLVLAVGCRREPDRIFGGHHLAGGLFWDRTPTISHTFEIPNPTGKTIKILGIQTSCTCTKSELDRKVLGPGETARLLMEVNVPRNLNSRNVICTLQSDYEPQIDWNYVISFHSYPRLRVDPTTVTLAAETGAGSVTLERYSEPGSPAASAPEVIPAEGVSVSMLRDPEFETVGGGVLRARFRATVELLPDTVQSANRLEITVTFKIETGEQASALAIWDRGGPYTVTPSLVHFGMVRGDEPKEIDVLVFNAKKTHFRLVGSRFTSEAGATEILGDIGPGSAPSDRHLVRLRFTSPGSQPRRAASGDVVLETDDEQYPRLVIPWSAFFVARGGEQQ